MCGYVCVMHICLYLHRGHKVQEKASTATLACGTPIPTRHFPFPILPYKYVFVHSAFK